MDKHRLAFDAVLKGAALIGGIGRVRAPLALPNDSDIKEPLKNGFGNEPEHAEGQNEEQDEGAESPRFRLSGEVLNNEQHEADVKRQAPGHPDFGDPFFGQAKHGAMPSGPWA
jgi:hypothetical protein